MKLAKIKWNGEEEIRENILLSTVQEVYEYSQMTSDTAASNISEWLKGRIPPNRWDHYIRNTGTWGNPLVSAVSEMFITGKNAIYTVDTHIHKKYTNMCLGVIAGHKIVVNKVGGYCYLTDKLHEVISIEDFIKDNPRFYVINEGTQWMNLENDPQVEERTKEYLGAIDPNFSYICHLHQYAEVELRVIFKEFKDKGGIGIHVYTTAGNITQMEEYSRAIVHAGIKNVIFEFNAGINDDIVEVVSWLQNKNINVEIVE